jgi:DNA-binding transcriptional ArsR family regulator
MEAKNMDMTASHARHVVFQAVADPTRRQILKLLADRGMPVASITEEFPITRTAVNKHLFVLSEAGLVTSKKLDVKFAIHYSQNRFRNCSNGFHFLRYMGITNYRH